MRFEAVIQSGSQNRIEIEQLAEGRFSVNGQELGVDWLALAPGLYSLIVDGNSWEVSVREEKKLFVVGVGAHQIRVRLEDPLKSRGEVASPLEGGATISSPMPGRVVGIKGEVGQVVREGEGLILVEAMKMENELHAPKGGRITKIAVKLGDAVEAGQELVVIE